MPASNELFSYNDIAAAVAAGQMLWSGAPQSGNYALTWLQFRTYVLYDGTNPTGYGDTQCFPYSYALARAIIQPTSVTATLLRNCVACTYSVSGSWGSRPAGWNAYVNFNGTGFVNMGQVNSGSWAIDNSNASYSFIVYYSNGTTTTPQVTSNSVAMTVCSACPQ